MKLMMQFTHDSSSALILLTHLPIAPWAWPCVRDCHVGKTLSTSFVAPDCVTFSTILKAGSKQMQQQIILKVWYLCLQTPTQIQMDSMTVYDTNA